MMKRAILSTILFVTFGTYTLFERSGGVDALYVTPTKTTGGENVSVLYPTAEEPTTLPPKKATTSTTVEPVVIVEKPKIVPATKTTPAPKPLPAPVKTTTGLYRDGEYTGDGADAYYGIVQVKAIIQGGKIADVQFLSYPNDRSTSIEINTQAMPYLITETIQAQSANVDTVSGASETSGAFRESLASALAKAKN